MDGECDADQPGGGENNETIIIKKSSSDKVESSNQVDGQAATSDVYIKVNRKEKV